MRSLLGSLTGSRVWLILWAGEPEWYDESVTACMTAECFLLCLAPQLLFGCLHENSQEWLGFELMPARRTPCVKM